MNLFVINLDRRPDRLSHIRNTLAGHKWSKIPAYDGKGKTYGDFVRDGFTPDMEWIDPLLKRSLTPTEIACFISHYKCWRHLADSNNEGIIILEDDVTLERPLDTEKISQLLKLFDIVYLGYREMDEARELNKELVVPSYPYLASSYAITREAARKLLSTTITNNVIPVDEYLPIMIGYDKPSSISIEKHINIHKDAEKLSAIAFKDPYFTQLSRSVMGSDIEREAPLMNYDVKVITVATDESKMETLQTSADKFGIELVNLGRGVQWRGGTMTGPGGGQKLNLVKKYLNSLENIDNTIILFVDGYDVVFNDGLQTIVDRFRDPNGFQCDVLFAAEKICWPDKSLAQSFPEVGTEYKYLNSGIYIGYARAIQTLLQEGLDDSDDDQKYLQLQYIKYLNEKQFINCQLDIENYIFQCMSAAANDVVVKENKQVLNKATRCCPCVIHGNGGPNDKQTFDNLAKQLGIKTFNTGISFIKTKDFEIVDTDILCMDFLTPEMCRKLIEKADAYGKWESMYGDKFPGQELRIRELDRALFEQLEDHFTTTINPVVEKYWWPLAMYGLRDAFIIRYDMEKQKELKCHHDASLVSGIVRLNDDYTGGDTYFYRQKYSNKDVPVGRMVLWPGQVTHGHEGRPLTSGTKYNLVIWTSRRKGDINYDL